MAERVIGTVGCKGAADFVIDAARRVYAKRLLARAVGDGRIEIIDPDPGKGFYRGVYLPGRYVRRMAGEYWRLVNG